MADQIEESSSGSVPSACTEKKSSAENREENPQKSKRELEAEDQESSREDGEENPEEGTSQASEEGREPASPRPFQHPRNFPMPEVPPETLTSKMVTHLCIPVSLGMIVASIMSKEYLNPGQEPTSNVWKLFYLVSFAIHFGAQIWMSLVAGLFLYFSLPRHVFGQVQEVLFPFFFLFNGSVSFILIMSYIQTQPFIAPDSDQMLQVKIMTLTLFIELLTRLYLSPILIFLKHLKTRIEAEAGTGQEIGHQVLGELVNCPHYMGILKKFRRTHSVISALTVVTVICSLFHISYLYDKLCV